MIIQLSEWEGTSGWHCAYTDSFSSKFDNWVLPARALGMEMSEYVKWVIDNYVPDEVTCTPSLVGFTWKDQNQMRKYKNYMNKVLRKFDFGQL